MIGGNQLRLAVKVSQALTGRGSFFVFFIQFVVSLYLVYRFLHEKDTKSRSLALAVMVGYQTSIFGFGWPCLDGSWRPPLFFGAG